MKTSLSISQHNIKPHIDIEKDIQTKKNGLFTFNLRISQGNIEDYKKYETITSQQYKGVTFFYSEERTFSYDPRVRGQEDAVRRDERQRNP